MKTVSLKVKSESAGTRLDVYLAGELELTRSHIKILGEQGNISMPDGAIKMGRLLKPDEQITVSIPEPTELSLESEDIPLDIIYEDNSLAVINKQRRLVVHPAKGSESGTLVNALLYRLKNLSGINGVIRPGIVHRLDKDTTGLIVIAKTDAAHISLSKQIADKTCRRTYIALLEGVLPQDCGTIDAPIGRSRTDRKKMAVVRNIEDGRSAVTDYKVIERFSAYTLAEFYLRTGRTHQIRVHAKHIGHAVVGDLVYNSKTNRLHAPSQMLHAKRLEFIHPITGKEMCFEAPCPSDFMEVIKKLKDKKGD